MSRVFQSDGSAPLSELRRIACKNETTELQDRLHRNWELLAGDQMTPKDPRRWLLIRREMPVNSPSTGQKYFSLDFLFTDQDGVPTFVEAKRCNDPRARREVIGQMLEYVANGRAYWSKEELKSAFLETQRTADNALPDKAAQSAASALKSLRGQGEEDLDAFFSSFTANLQSGRVRLVFFLEDSSYELRTLAEFLNEQLKSAEVFVVEARQYQVTSGGATVIVPRVVGFTESTRVAKELIREEAKKTQLTRGEDAFWVQITAALPEQGTAARDFIRELQSIPHANVTWFVSAVFLLPEILSARGLFGVRRSGQIEVYLYYWNPEKYPDITQAQIAFCERFVAGLKELDLLRLGHSPAYPTISASIWIPKWKALVGLIRILTEDLR